MRSQSQPPQGSSLHLVFGVLRLELLLNKAGLLCAVNLPELPPPTLSRFHLFEAQRALASFPLEKAASTGLDAFRRALEAIPPGQTRTYGALARSLGTSPRAIGSRCAANRLLLRVPCHRVTAENGPGGFRLGPEWKQSLLALEASSS